MRHGHAGVRAEGLGPWVLEKEVNAAASFIILRPDDRVVVSESDATAVVMLRSRDDLLRAGRAGQRIHLATFGDIPVLAELAAEVATCGT